MHNVHIMQRLEPIDKLDEYPPDLSFLHVLALPLMVMNALQQIAVVGVFYNDAKTLRVLIEECLLVP